MCIVIDTNTFASVFDPTSARHADFKPVWEWIINGNGKVVYGGTKYKTELARAGRYRRLFKILSDMRKTVVISDREIDEVESNLIGNKLTQGFNDCHLVAISIISKCKILCSVDSNAYPLIKNPLLYPKGCQRPSIYSQFSNKNLLTNKNIADICLPCLRLNKEQKELLGLA